jgi:hypothetical protein
VEVFLHPPQVRAGEPLEVRDEVLHRLLARGRVEDVRLRPVEEHVGVQHREQERVDAQLRRNQGEAGGAVGHFTGGGLRVGGHSSVRGSS